MKLIDKDALVAEIERRKEIWQHQDQQYVAGGRDVCDYLLGFLDTFEVKEVDFEKAYKSYMESLKDDISGNNVTVNIKYLARHFFELGLKTKGE